MLMMLGLFAILYIAIWVFAGIIAVGLTILTLIGIAIWFILKEVDKRKVREVSRAELLREIYDLMLDEEFIKEVEEGVTKPLGYRKSYDETAIKYETDGDSKLREVYKEVEKYWGLKGISMGLEDNTDSLLGGYTLIFKEKDLTSIQRERNKKLLKEEEEKLREIADRDRLVQGEVIRIINKLKGKEEEVRGVLIDGGEIEYRIDEGGLGQIEERNIVELIKYAESWLDKGVGSDIVIEEGNQKIKFYIAKQ